MRTFLKFFLPFFVIFFVLGLWSGRRARLAGVDPHMEIGQGMRVDLTRTPLLVEFVCDGRPVWQFDIDNKAAQRTAPNFSPRLTALSLTERWEASYVYALGAFGGVVELGKMSPGSGTQAQKVIGIVGGIVSGYTLGFGLAYYSHLDCASPEVYGILTSKTAGTDCQPDIWRAVAAPKIFVYGRLTDPQIQYPASYTLWQRDFLYRVANGDEALKTRLIDSIKAYNAAGFHAHSGVLTAQDLLSTRDAVALVEELYKKYPDRFKINDGGTEYQLSLNASPRH